MGPDSYSSPEGILLGLTYTPVMRESEAESE